MLDPNLFRNELDATATLLKKRFVELDVELIKSLETRRKETQVLTQNLQNERNIKSKSIGKAKAKGEDIQPLLNEVSDLGEKLTQAESSQDEILDQLNQIFVGIPNISHESVPVGKTEEDNLEVRRWSEPKSFDFDVKDHVDLGEQSTSMDFEVAVTITGSRFVSLNGALARMHRALIQLMLDTHTMDHGYQEVYVPYLVNEDSLKGTGQLPKFAEELYKIEGDVPFYLIPTAEVPVTNMVRGKILKADDFPCKFVAHTPCFRSEAGAYGKDTRGMIRQHQFEKVELVQMIKPENSYQALEELTGHAEAILQKLDLPYRVVTLCTGDLGFSSAKTYDLEVWLPGQDAFREISSCSNFEDFQARRLKARWRNPDAKKPQLIHTVNGSGLAVGRTLVAVMENYQTDTGNIRVPDVLQPYMGGMKTLFS
ncbi:MAG: serine--tRNA ligase [Methylococcales bacterium]|jgi:seryl-tRNA synthetase|nr:serine--tRNA ligase [Methylococcales bacterium]MBT7409148.1 serine--tRNA ligase [Methylococcales bacterium]